MRTTLDAIVAKFKHPSATRPAEPTYTLELTVCNKSRTNVLPLTLVVFDAVVF